MATIEDKKIQKKARILVVDDEPDITKIIKNGLESFGYYVVDAFNQPQEALLHFKPYYYDILIFGINMPKMNGFHLYREIRKKDDKVGICFMTAFDVYRDEFEKMFPSYDVKCFIKNPLK